MNLVKRTIGPSSGGPLRSPERRKGIRLNIPESGVGSYGNVTELGDGRHCPGESSLFSLTGQTSLELYRTEIGSDGWQSIPISGVSGAQRLFHENPRDGSVLDPGPLLLQAVNKLRNNFAETTNYVILSIAQFTLALPVTGA